MIVTDQTKTQAFGFRSITRLASLGALAGTMLVASGCTAVMDRRGYVIDPSLVASIQPGIDNRDSVQGTLGQPSFASQFGDDPTWYYVSSVTEQRVLGIPQTEQHRVIKVAFDNGGNVASVTEAGMDDVRKISPDGDKTEVMGRDRSFLEDLFGNIGTVGAMGGSGGAAGGTGPNGS